MMSFFTDLLKTELKAHPHLFFMLALFAASIMGYSYKVFAQQSWVAGEIAASHKSFKEVDDRIDDLEQKIDLRYYEQRLHANDSEVFSLERLEGNGEATTRDLKRLGDLRIEHDRLERKIENNRD